MSKQLTDKAREALAGAGALDRALDVIAAIDGVQERAAIASLRRPVFLGKDWQPIDGAPGLTWRHQSKGRREARWRARTDIARRGFRPETVRLWYSSREPNETERAEISRACERLQNEMLDWSANPTAIRKKVTYGRIYFIRQGHAVKIGFSQNVFRRLQFLQTCHHEELSIMAEIPGAPCEEVVVHRKFQHLRIRGEWFRLEPELEQFIREKMT